MSLYNTEQLTKAIFESLEWVVLAGERRKMVKFRST